jgi:hypothetical protein
MHEVLQLMLAAVAHNACTSAWYLLPASQCLSQQVTGQVHQQVQQLTGQQRQYSYPSESAAGLCAWSAAVQWFVASPGGNSLLLTP